MSACSNDILRLDRWLVTLKRGRASREIIASDSALGEAPFHRSRLSSTGISSGAKRRRIVIDTIAADGKKPMKPKTKRPRPCRPIWDDIPNDSARLSRLNKKGYVRLTLSSLWQLGQMNGVVRRKTFL